MSVPSTIDEACSPQWLSEALGTKIVHVDAGPVDDRVSTNLPVDIRTADGAELKVWVKGYFTESGSLMRFTGVPEVYFYRELADRAGLRTARCLFGEVDPVTSYNVLVTEDVGAGVIFPDGRLPCTPDQTANSLEQLAALHAATWLDERSASAPWLESRLSLYTGRRGAADIATNFEGPTGSGVPETVRDAERLVDSYKLLAEEVAAADPWCVVHGDSHIRNVYLDGDAPYFMDWQLVQRGPWYLDVAYHITSMLSVEDRRAHFERLVEHYLDNLESRGIERPSPPQVEHGMHLSLVHGFYLWAITLRVDPRATTQLLTRLGTAVDDYEALDELHLGR
jgi:Phosphotransferase enzyme family